jgi:nucleoside-diphosphate-sugar epimerase
MKVLVTGATGFIGSHVVHALLGEGHEVRALVRPSSQRDRLADLKDDIEWVEADLLASPVAELEPALRGLGACIHAAWYVEPGRYLRALENVAWVGASVRLLQALAESGCPRAVFVGTCFEYDHSFGYLSETTPTAPRSLYGAAKLATYLTGERVAEDLGIGFAWGRLFYQYGPYEAEGRLVPAVIRSLLGGEEAHVTEGRQIRDFLHVKDVASALTAVMSSDCTGSVNIGSGHPVSVRELVATIATRLGAPHLVRYGARPTSPSDPPFICANNTRLRDEVGWQPAFDLQSGLDHTIEWWSSRMYQESSA